ncbi:HHR069Wp [Eremothecium sinecaudum]|uniref:HHR069Wp n=1 Tax=Eremothecium sinecaudum TaxID=45286 RepID=A0A0X8HWR2_9SACH|nr:HHR069Wp [Eremothecium sinecaudum]AMD22838.1 HHR069Wp [Eremothecium sinecaudum]
MATEPNDVITSSHDTNHVAEIASSRHTSTDIHQYNHHQSGSDTGMDSLKINTGLNTPDINSSHSLPTGSSYGTLRTFGLSHLTAKQHFLIAICRDMSLLPPMYSLFCAFKMAWRLPSYPHKDLLHSLPLANSIHSMWNNNVIRNLRQHASEAVATPAQAVISRGEDIQDYFWLLNAMGKMGCSEYLLCAMWCVVSMYLTYAILDSLMIRWIVKYSTFGAIVRMFSMSMIIITVELLLLSSLSPDKDYYLHSWILISCTLTGAYIWQSFLTSNLNCVDKDASMLASTSSAPSTKSVPSNPSSVDSLNSVQTPNSVQSYVISSTKKRHKKGRKFDFEFSKKRSIDLYNITVFCVVPVGMASFITMLGLLRKLVIYRLDVEQLGRLLKELYLP